MKKYIYDYSLIKGAMINRGVTQEALAKMIGVAKSSLNLKLLGKRYFTPPEMQAIAEALDLRAYDRDMFGDLSFYSLDKYFFTVKKT